MKNDKNNNNDKNKNKEERYFVSEALKQKLIEEIVLKGDGSKF